MKRLLSPLLLLCLLPQHTQAEVVISGTRIIYPQAKRELTLQLNNVGSSPALVQSWIDHGDPKVQPEEEQVPFVILPPIVRIEPQQGQNLRILFSGANTPQDRESLFWFNVLEIPPQPEHQQEINYLQFAVRSRIKLFFRPSGLKADPVQAAEQLQWHRQGQTLTLRNPGPYHVTLSKVSLNNTELPELAGKMVTPFDTLQVSLPNEVAQARTLNLHFANINDFGANDEHQLKVGG